MVEYTKSVDFVDSRFLTGVLHRQNSKHKVKVTIAVRLEEPRDFIFVVLQKLVNFRAVLVDKTRSNFRVIVSALIEAW